MSKDLPKNSQTISARTAKPNHHQEAPRPEVMPIYQTSVFTFDDVDDVEEYYANHPEGRYLYTRNGNPNIDALTETLAKLENTEVAYASASGMGAISAAIMGVCHAGDHIVMSNEIYGGTLVLLRTVLNQFGITFSFADFQDHDAIERAMLSTTKLLIAESISNPLLRVIDLEAIAAIAHNHHAYLLIDNTFATPLIVQPAHHGADIVVHSATKYFGGHSDVSGGVICTSTSLGEAMSHIITTLGATLAPFDAWLIARGVKTLSLRFREQCKNAAQIASFLTEQSVVSHVFYPGLSTHESHTKAKKQFQDDLYGAMVSFRLHGGKEAVNRFMQAATTIPFAPSLAGVYTTLSYPYTTSHRGFTEQERLDLGITEGLLRLSVGIEHAADLLAEIGEALSVMK